MNVQATGGPAGEAGPLSRFDAVYSRIEDVFALIAAIAIFFVMGVGIAEVVLRTIFNFSIFGYLDLIELTMAVFAFLSAAYCQRFGTHIRMDLVVSLLKGRAQHVVECFAIFVALVAVAILVKATTDHFIRSYDSGDSTIDANLLVWPSKIMAPIGLSLLWLRLLLNFVGFLRLIAYPDAPRLAVPPPPGGGHGAAEEEHV
ncbi:MAG: TRAP transporter small permease subunit [Reyranellaceae bacterium]